MNLRQLEYFVTVAEELHFARAAERLHIAQQPLSFQIKQLEEEIGVRLFERTTRRVELTEAGEALLCEVQKALHHLQRGIETAQRIEHGEQGRLVVGYIGPTLYNLLPGTMRLFQERYPKVEVILRDLYSPYLDQQILNGDLDAGLMAREMEHPELAWEGLFSEAIHVAVPKAHPFAACASIPLRSLADEPFVMYDRVQKPLSHAQVALLCRAAGFSPRIAQEASSAEGMIGLVAAGVGVSLATASMRGVRADEVAYCPLIEPAIQVEFGVAWKRDNPSPLVQALVRTAREVVQHECFGMETQQVV